MTAVLSSTNLMEKNIDSDLYDNGEAFCRFLHSAIVGSRVLLLYQQEEEGDKTTTHVIYTGIRSVWAPPSDGCLQYGCNTSLMTGSA